MQTYQRRNSRAALQAWHALRLKKTPETASDVIHSSEREGWQGSPITLIAFQIFKLCSLFGAVAERAPGRPCFRGKVLKS